MTLFLYSTAGCHLCDDALIILKNMPELPQEDISVIEIGDDDALVNQYGIRIPVLRIGLEELDWPFTTEQVSLFIHNKINN
ncbi:MAG TPA: glutaredoxin family protein [Methylophaga aminisulfidivorans]|uniref:Glutaredoxin family protein n=1 Tax=Methylophaga aminisulfidivorans TaxID=230105 RepID=A0A7C1ZUE5_9GAMM|nr:glutaredoxin family protein [Methylophaga aminisulfidivorans]